MTERYSFRDLITIADFRQVFALERDVWELPSGDDAVPVNLLAASVPHGAILVGAFDETSRLVGFVYSFPALSGGRLIQWSHMLGVDARHRGGGLGRRLKLEQRARALGQGIQVIAWTFDPLQDLNAAFNLNVLGAESHEYLEDVYGASDSPLHAGAPTDRLAVEWDLSSERVRSLADVSPATARPPRPTGSDVADQPLSGFDVHRVSHENGWMAPHGEPDLGARGAVVGVPVPARFTAMLREQPDLARRWRSVTRLAFSAYFSRGYRAVRFARHESGGGSYELSATEP